MVQSDGSLWRTNRKAWDVPAAIALSAGLLAAGLCLPVMKVEKLIFWESSYTLVSGSINLARDGDWFLACVLFTFSVLFPIAKLGALALVWFRPMDPRALERRLGVIGQLGKWSMLDVFVVAFLVVLTKSKALGGISAQPGLYVFSAAVVLSMLVTMRVERLAKTAGAQGGAGPNP